ncbi:MAG: ABC transporter permease, partial [Planctomycetota bacterium]
IYWTVCWLGDPEPGPVFTGYFGAALMAASYLAISCLFSAITRSQPISFILGVVACWIFMSIGSPALLGVLPDGLGDFLSSISFATHYDTIQRGVIELRNVFFLVVVTLGFLVACNVMLDERKAQ